MDRTSLSSNYKFIEINMEENMAKKYPAYKKVAWRFGRLFLASFLVLAGPQIASVGSLDDVLPLVITPALIGAVGAVGKALREEWGNGDYTAFVNKLPV